VRVCVCTRAHACVRVYGRKSDAWHMYVWMRKIEREREKTCVRERERVCACAREGDNER